jgi:hypothetical protein
MLMQQIFQRKTVSGKKEKAGSYFSLKHSGRV